MSQNITETWTHADTASGITADHAWTTVSGTPRIVNNVATVDTAVNGFATLDTLMDTANYTIEADIAAGTTFGSGQINLVARFQDSTNYYEMFVQAGAAGIARWVGGVKTLLRNTSFTPAAGQRLRFTVNDSNLSIWYQAVSGTGSWVQISTTATDSTFLTQKKVGIRLVGTTSTIRVDNFTAVDAPKSITVSVPAPYAYEKTVTGTPKPGRVRLTLSETQVGDLVIPISVAGSTAIAGTHYTALAATATVPNGQSFVDITVTPILQGGVFSPESTVRVTPSPVGGYVIGTVAYGEVTLRQIERGKYGGIVGAAPTSILRFTNSDGKHTVNDPVSGPVGYYRVGLVNNRYVLVDPEGWCMLPRGVWGAADAIMADGSSGSVFYNGVKENIGFDPGRNSNQESYSATNEVAPRLSRMGFNFFGGYTPQFAMPYPRNGAAVNAGSPLGIVPTQRKDSPDRKPVEWFVSLQKQAMRWKGVKNITQGITGSRGFQGPAQMADAFDDPSVIPGAPGRFSAACDGTVRGLIRDENHVATEAQWTTNTTGDPEYPAPYSTPWIIYMDMFERDWWSGQAEYHRHMGYSVFCSVPTMTSYVDPGGVTHTLTGADQINYSKIAFSNWLKAKYTTIGALNTAWNTSNFYTTFDSAGGYGVGTGVLDEDGKKAWLGWNGSSADGVSLSGCSQTVRDDLDGLMEYFIDQNFRLMCAGARAALPNVLLVCPANDDETPWIFTKVASQYVDMTSSYRDGGGGSSIPVTAATYGLTLSATSGNPVTVTATSGTPFSRSRVGRLIHAGTGTGVITRYLDSTHVEMEVLTAFASTSIGAGQWFLKGKSVSAWLKYHLPGIQWTTILCEESQYPAAVHNVNTSYLGNQYNSAASYYGFPAGAVTQANRAAIYRQMMFDRFNAQAPDGKYYDLGIDWWQWAGRTSEGIDFGLIALSDDMLDGVEKPQFGDFVTPVQLANAELDYLLLQEAAGTAPPPPAITGDYHAGDTTVNGTANPSVTVTVFVGGVSAGTTTSNSSGVWAKTVSALSEGNVLTATQTVSAITSIPSAAVVVLAATLAVPAITGTYVERDTVINGTGVVGAVVTVVMDDGTTQVTLGTTTVGPAGTWTLTSPILLLEDDDLTASQTLGGLTSNPSSPAVTVGAPSPARVRVQIIRFVPGSHIIAVLRALVPRNEMPRYADPNAKPLYPKSLPVASPTTLDSLKIGRVVERRIILSAKTITTEAAAHTALETAWTAFQNSITASNTSGGDGFQSDDTTWDGTTWS